MQRVLIVIDPDGVEVLSDGELEVHVQREGEPSKAMPAVRETPESLSAAIEERSADPSVPEDICDAVEAATGRYVPPKHVLRLIESYASVATPRLKSRFDAILAVNSIANHYVRSLLANETDALRIVLACRKATERKGAQP